MAKSKAQEDDEAREQVAILDALERNNRAKAELQAERDAHAETMRKEAMAGKSELEMMLAEMSQDVQHEVRMRAFAHYLQHMPNEPMSRQSDVDGICRRFCKYMLFGEAT